MKAKSYVVRGLHGRILAGMLGVALVVLQAGLAPIAKASYPRLISGSYEGTSWTFGAEHRNGQRCVEGSTNSGSSVSCQIDANTLWSNGARLQVGERSSRSAVIFFFLNSRVGYLKVRVHSVDHHGYRWLRVQARRMTEEQRALTHFGRDVSYGVVASRGISNAEGDVCLQRVVAFDKTGRRIGRSPILVCAKSKSAKALY